MRLGKCNAHLHWAAGAHRVAVGKERFARGHHVDKVFEDLAQILFRRGRVDSLGVALPIRG